MKKISFKTLCACFMCAFLCLVSCQKSLPEGYKVNTGDVLYLTDTYVELGGTFEVPEGCEDQVRYGIVLSAFRGVIWADECYAPGKFKVTIDGLRSGSTYRYHAVLRVGSQELTGVEQSFATVSETAIICSEDHIEADFQEQSFIIRIDVANPVPGKVFSATSSDDFIRYLTFDLASNQLYFTLKEHTGTENRHGSISLKYGNLEKEIFITQRFVTNLSANGTANCYIVPKTGDYYFVPTKGNSSQAITGISEVVLLWETFENSYSRPKFTGIKDIRYSGNKVIFSTLDPMGNALIAAKDASGTILWSWHIWMTEKPADQEYRNGAGVMMDRDLGATQAVPSKYMYTTGLLYQWGRKDPFLRSDIEPGMVKSDPKTGTIEYSIQNPTTFITGNEFNGDWFFGTHSDSTDGTRWDPDWGKRIYDPCPPGYMVPLRTVWEKATPGLTWLAPEDRLKGWADVSTGMDLGAKARIPLGSG